MKTTFTPCERRKDAVEDFVLEQRRNYRAKHGLWAYLLTYIFA